MSKTYCYDGDCGLDASQLFWLIAVETTMQEFGLDDVAAAMAIVSGANFVPTRRKPMGAINNTSIASIVSRRLFRKRKFPGGYRAPSLVDWMPPRVSLTPYIGAFVGRAIPVVGWAYTAAELGLIGYKTVTLYDSIVDPEDQVF